MTAAEVGIHRASQQHEQNAADAEESMAVGRRRASSVVPNNSLVNGSRKYQPAGNGPPSRLR